ncbi:MAG: hypothetical protein AB9891_16235 [Anaerolineaceae bacterium]
MIKKESDKITSGANPILSRVSSLADSFWKRQRDGFLVGLTLFILAALCYGWMVIQPGLFGDDWPYLWSYHLFGSDGFRQFVEWDRPFSAFIYLIAGPIFAENVWGYHLFVLLSRWLGSVVFWLILRRLWPERGQLAFWAACLFQVYPGFIQQPHSLEFILHFSVLLLFLLSMYWMLLSTEKRSGRVFFLIGSIVFSLNIFALEYYLGLELLRPVMLWIVFHRAGLNIRKTLIKTALTWAPYLAVLILYSYWRAFVFKFPTYQPTFLQDVLGQPVKALVGLTMTIFSNLRAVLPGAWRQVFELEGRQPLILILTGLVFISILILTNFYFQSFTKVTESGKDKEGKFYEPLMVGGLALILAGVPYWITGLPVLLEFPWDRSTLSFLFGVSLLTAGLAEMLRPFYRTILLAALVSLAVGFHLQNNTLYRAEWEKLRSFFWQLSWRAPGLETGSIFLSENVPLYYYSDNSLTPVVNWMYASDHHSPDIPYNYLEMGERLGKALPALETDLEVVHGYRFVTFRGSSSNLIPLSFSPPGCLRILMPEDQSLPGLPHRLAQAVNISNASSLINDGSINSAVMPEILKPEPEHGWCHTFEKADLAAQLEKWEEVVRLAEEAEAAGLSPSDETEWLPFLKAHAALGNLEKTRELTELIRQKEGVDQVLCAAWKGILSRAPEDGADTTELREIAAAAGGCQATGE